MDSILVLIHNGFIVGDSEHNQEAVKSCKRRKNGLLIIDERNGPTNDGTLPHPKINIIMEESCKMGFFFFCKIQKINICI